MITTPNRDYFSERELSCNCCGRNAFNKGTLHRFNCLREELGEPMNMTSGFRCYDYNNLMGYTQTHTTGQAGDIHCSHKLAYKILSLAPKYGFIGIGIKQKGNGITRFIHLDDLENDTNHPRPHIWSY